MDSGWSIQQLNNIIKDAIYLLYSFAIPLHVGLSSYAG